MSGPLRAAAGRALVAASRPARRSLPVYPMAWKVLSREPRNALWSLPRGMLRMFQGSWGNNSDVRGFLDMDRASAQMGFANIQVRAIYAAPDPRMRACTP